MRKSSQQGLSLTSFIFFGIAVVMCIVYGKAFIGIPYDGYKIGNILTSIIKEDPGSDKEIRKMFITKTQFENLDKAASPNDLTIDRTGGGLKLSITYQQCEDLWKNWSVCADMSITK